MSELEKFKKKEIIFHKVSQLIDESLEHTEKKEVAHILERVLRIHGFQARVIEG